VPSTDTAYRLAEIYAQPLFDLAVEQQQVEAVEEDMNLIMALQRAVPLLGRFLVAPFFLLEQKWELLQKVFSRHLNKLTLRFLQVLLKHNRAFYLGDIAARFCALCDVHAGRCTVDLTVAAPLSQEEQAQVAAQLADALKTQIQLNLKVDPSILGGTIIRYDGRRVDNSVQGRLQRVIHSITHAGKGQVKGDEI
jgi:F-type H+-transporting ATPase subunit delta